MVIWFGSVIRKVQERLESKESGTQELRKKETENESVISSTQGHRYG
jgi:hypothetical protein